MYLVHANTTTNITQYTWYSLNPTPILVQYLFMPRIHNPPMVIFLLAITFVCLNHTHRTPTSHPKPANIHKIVDQHLLLGGILRTARWCIPFQIIPEFSCTSANPNPPNYSFSCCNTHSCSSIIIEFNNSKFSFNFIQSLTNYNLESDSLIHNPNHEPSPNYAMVHTITLHQHLFIHQITVQLTQSCIYIQFRPPRPHGYHRKS